MKTRLSQAPSKTNTFYESNTRGDIKVYDYNLDGTASPSNKFGTLEKKNERGHRTALDECDEGKQFGVKKAPHGSKIPPEYFLYILVPCSFFISCLCPFGAILLKNKKKTKKRIKHYSAGCLWFNS